MTATQYAIWKREGWLFAVRGYYGPDAKPPRREGDVAFETRHRSESSRDIEILAAKSRPDIGRVEDWPL